MSKTKKQKYIVIDADGRDVVISYDNERDCEITCPKRAFELLTKYAEESGDVAVGDKFAIASYCQEIEFGHTFNIIDL